MAVFRRQGEFISLSLSEDSDESGSGSSNGDDAPTKPKESVLATEKLKPRKKLPPLLVALADRKPEPLHWIGVSYGVTLELFNFWQRFVGIVCVFCLG
jgi:N-acetyltransferase 10